MKHLIDKDALVTWVESQIDILERNSGCSGIFGEIQMAVFDRLYSFLDTLEVKDVDLEKEVDSQMDLLCNLLCYMDELSNGDSEGVYPLPENVIEDLQRFAKHFFELGLKVQK